MSKTEPRGRVMVAVVLLGLFIVAVAAFGGAGGASAGESHRAGLVIEFGEGLTETRCIEFSEEEITGAELLRRSGLTLVLSDYGGLGDAVCRIGDTGCSDPDDCFCRCRGAECPHWSYYALEDGAWDFQNMGASQRRLRDGDVDGWIWGSGRTPPEQVTFGEVCPLAIPTQPPPPPTPAAAPQQESGEPRAVAPPARPPAPNEPIPSTQLEPATASDSSEPAEATAEPAADRSEAGSVPPATEEVRQVAGLVEDPGDGGRAGDSGLDAALADEGGGGVPMGLIAFGVVAGVLAGGIGGVTLWRRRVG